MALDELHARRLTTVVAMVEKALDRIETVLRSAEPGDSFVSSGKRLTPQQAAQLRGKIETLRGRLREISERFSIRRLKPEPRQVLAAELSSLWVILENALPKRLKGYGREFDPADKADWEKLVQGLLQQVEELRRIALSQKSRS